NPIALVDDPRVASGALAQAGHEIAEQLVRDVLSGDLAGNPPSRGKVVGLCLGDQALYPAPQLLRLGLGGGDPPVLQQGRAKVAHQRLASVRVAVEVAAALEMPHPFSLSGSPRPTPRSRLRGDPGGRQIAWGDVMSHSG